MPKILLQLKLGDETSKSGFLPEEISRISYDKPVVKQLNIVGLMGISQNTADQSKIRKQFSQISNCSMSYPKRIKRSNSYRLECHKTII